MWWILVATFLSIFAPSLIGINFVTEKLHHIFHSKKRNLSPGTHSGSALA